MDGISVAMVVAAIIALLIGIAIGTIIGKNTRKYADPDNEQVPMPMPEDDPTIAPRKNTTVAEDDPIIAPGESTRI